ncbi:uncharacterized protein [Dendropsophus ebraccatus]|uniref:uncharacterized protein isoform X9 n=1 Tax=Dendropsophus ebraccatus TaxID=150705 RepID=UPI0038312E71
MGPRAQLLLLLGLLSCCCRGEEQVKLLSGSDAVFRADVSDRPSEITWLIGRDKIVDLEQGRLPDFYRMKERVVADLEKGTLILKVVTPADSGQYRANRLVEGKIFTNDFRLLVFASGKRSYGLYGLIILPIIIVFIGLGVLHRKGRHQDGGKQSGNQEPGAGHQDGGKQSGNQEPGAGHQDGGKQSGNQGPGAGHQDGGKQSGNQGPGADPDLLALEETSSLL